MVKTLLLLLFSFSFMFNKGYNRTLEYDKSVKVYSGAPGYIVVIPNNDDIGRFQDYMINCRTVCKLNSFNNYNYENVSLYRLTNTPISDCHYGYYKIGEEIVPGTYKITNTSDVAKSVQVYEDAYYDSKHITKVIYLDPHSSTDTIFDKGIIYNDGCIIEEA